MRKLFSARKLLIQSLLLGFISVFAIGCGSSSEDFVVTNQQGVNNTGSLVFQFAQAQIANVPQGTAFLQFELFDGPSATGNLVTTRIVDFNVRVVLENVPVGVQSARVTALDANNVPTATVVDDVQVVAGAESEVDLTDATIATTTPQTLTLAPDPLIISGNVEFPMQILGQITLPEDSLTGSFTNNVLFNTGSTVDVPGSDVTYTFADTELLNVSASGVFTANFTGNTTVTANYTLNGTTVNDSATVLVEAFICDWAETGNDEINIEQFSSEDIFACFFPSTGGDFAVDTDVNVTVSPDISGVSVSQGRGLLIEVEDVNPGTVLTITVSYTDPASGRSFSDVLTATVVASEE